jgi:hypothetical protein
MQRRALASVFQKTSPNRSGQQRPEVRDGGSAAVPLFYNRVITNPAVELPLFSIGFLARLRKRKYFASIVYWWYIS